MKDLFKLIRGVLALTVMNLERRSTWILGLALRTRPGRQQLFVRASCMNVLSAISPGLKVLFERVGKPEIVNRPELFRSGGAGAVVACNHVGWADSLWMAYAVYPRQLRYIEIIEAAHAELAGTEHAGRRGAAGGR